MTHLNRLKEALVKDAQEGAQHDSVLCAYPLSLAASMHLLST